MMDLVRIVVSVSLLCGVLDSVVLANPDSKSTVLHSFGPGSDGITPLAGLIRASDGDFYSTTPFGGTYGLGTVFKVSPKGLTTVVYTFGTNADDGTTSSAALVQGRDGNFYGTSAAGGANGVGTVFKVTPEGVETVLHAFSGYDGSAGTQGSADGANPGSALIQARDGNLYGTTPFGGIYNHGTVFKITPQGVETVLYSFGSHPQDGQYPLQLVEGHDGNFYGVTASGGSTVTGNFGGWGTAFKITASGIETVLHSFGVDRDDGWNPSTPLIEARDGWFYGATSSDGLYVAGTVYKMSSSGVVTVLYRFGTNPSGVDGTFPYGAPLVEDDIGNLYGTTLFGGASGIFGIAFKVSPNGQETILHSFTGGSDAGSPNGLIHGPDEALYGTSQNGGAYSQGTVFKLKLIEDHQPRKQ